MAAAAIHQAGHQDFEFSDHDFRIISELANARYGLFLQPSKKALVHSRLAKRLRALSLCNFEEYCNLIESPEGEAEQSHLLSALTTNVTHFFREMHHFDYLKSRIAPSLIEKARGGKPVRLWCSACSSGQEAYSIAAALIAADAKVAQYDIKILATDIDPKVVQLATQGAYPADQVSAIPEEWKRTLLLQTKRADSKVEIDPRLKSLISFGELNLVAEWPMRRPFDVIFCRNAAIYFDKATQARLWSRFSDALVHDGHLMIGHSERLSGPAEKEFMNVGITTYQKKPIQAAHRPKSNEGNRN